jgi:hypothetical protein
MLSARGVTDRLGSTRDYSPSGITLFRRTLLAPPCAEVWNPLTRSLTRFQYCQRSFGFGFAGGRVVSSHSESAGNHPSSWLAYTGTTEVPNIERVHGFPDTIGYPISDFVGDGRKGWATRRS